jgi:hypothetical protein
VVIGRDIHEPTGVDKKVLNRSIKMSVPTMRPNTTFKQWKGNFLTFLSLKAADLIPQFAIRVSGVWLDEQAQSYAYAIMVHAGNENNRIDHAVKCVSAARPECAPTAWEVMRERLNGRSFARSLLLLVNLMLRQCPVQSLIDYVHFMRQIIDDHNETCEVIDGSAAILPHHMVLLTLRGISATGPFCQANQCVINAFDTNYLMSADEAMANIFHLAKNMEEELPGTTIPAPGGHASPISAFVTVERGSHNGRGNTNRGGCIGRGMPNKCSGCGCLDHIMSSCAASDDALLKKESSQAQGHRLEVWQPQQHCPRTCCPP